MATHSFALIPTVAVTGGTSQLPAPPAGGSPTTVSPLEATRYWHAQGAARIEIIDLDTAHGQTTNHNPIKHIVSAMRQSVHIDLVAGVHDDATLAAWSDHGAAQLVLSTASLADLDFVGAASTSQRGGVAIRIVLGDGGTLHAPNTPADGLDIWTLLPQLEQLNISNYIVCDASHSTHWWQPHRDLLAEFCQIVTKPVTAGSGVDSLENLHHLIDLVPNGLDGAVVGRALNSGRFSYAEAVTAIQARYDPYMWGPAQP